MSYQGNGNRAALVDPSMLPPIDRAKASAIIGRNIPDGRRLPNYKDERELAKGLVAALIEEAMSGARRREAGGRLNSIEDLLSLGQIQTLVTELVDNAAFNQKGMLNFPLDVEKDGRVCDLIEALVIHEVRTLNESRRGQGMPDYAVPTFNYIVHDPSTAAAEQSADGQNAGDQPSATDEAAG